MNSPERPDQATAEEPSAPEASGGSYILRAEGGRFTITGVSVGFTVEGPPESPAGRRVESKPATGGLAASNSDASGSTWAELHEPLARGRANEAQALRLAVQAMRSRGASVRILEGARDDRGEDHLLEVSGKRVAVQVVSIPVDQQFWWELARTRSVQAFRSLDDAVGIVREAVDCRRDTARGAILILDASHIGAMCGPRLVDAYTRTYGSVDAEYDLSECWIVGPTSRSAFRIP